MTLLQTRVDEKTALAFARAAKQRGHTPYSYLQEVIKNAAALPEPRGWKNHRELIAGLNLKPLDYGAVERDRENDR